MVAVTKLTALASGPLLSKMTIEQQKTMKIKSHVLLLYQTTIHCHVSSVLQIYFNSNKQTKASSSVLIWHISSISMKIITTFIYIYIILFKQISLYNVVFNQTNMTF